MEGLTDSPTRRIIRSLGGCGLVVSEFISAEGLLRDVTAELKKLEHDVAEQPYSIQLAGKCPARIAEAASRVQDADASILDLNLGCPARKVMRNGAGSALLDQPELVREILVSVRRRISIPLTVKLRLGIDSSRLSFLEIASICEQEGVDAIALHARTARQQYGGEADWTAIRRLKEQSKIPVIGNGDVRQPEDALTMERETACDGVMIGRAAITNPWIFSQIESLKRTGKYTKPSLEERWKLLQHHTHLVAEHYPEDRLRFHRFRVLVRAVTSGLPGGRNLRRQLSEVGSFEELRDQVDGFFDRLLESESRDQ
jgi:nifR3 family TIM-barrel protein